MAKSLHDWSTTDGSNNFPTPDGAPEGWAVGQMNNTVRAIMGVVARFDRDNDGSLVTAGTTTAYTLALNQVNISAWYNGLRWRCRVNATSGATPTINPTPSGGSALGAKSLYWNSGTQVTTGDLVANGVYDMVYMSGADKVYVTSANGNATLASLGAAASSLTLTAGAGLTGGGDLSSNRSFAVGAGTGIVANADDVAVDKATQANMEAAASNKVVTADVQHYHPGHPKAWGYVTYSGGTPTLQTSYGVTSITDTNQGRLTVNLSITLSSTAYAVVATADDGGSGEPLICGVISKGTTSFEIQIRQISKSLVDPASVAFMVCGDL